MKKSKRLFLLPINHGKGYDKDLVDAHMYFKDSMGNYIPEKLKELNDFITETGKHIRKQWLGLETNL